MTQRIIGWETNLIKIVEDYKSTPFQWGQHDCCQFSGACVEAITGQNPLDKFPTKYINKKGGIEVLKTEGKGSLLKTLVFLFGPPISPAKAKRGDLVFQTNKGDPSVGVCLGQLSAFVGVENQTPGLVFLPTLSTIKAFSI